MYEVKVNESIYNALEKGKEIIGEKFFIERFFDNKINNKRFEHDELKELNNMRASQFIEIIQYGYELKTN